METIDLPFTVEENTYMSKLVIYDYGIEKLFEVVNIKPFHGRIKPPYLFIPDQLRGTLPCSKNYLDKDLVVTGAIEMAIRNKCSELNIPIFN